MSLTHLLIKNARIVRSREKTFEDSDILIDLNSGRIEKTDKEITLTRAMNAKVINAMGHLVVPAFTDLYARTGEPAYAYRDTISKSAEAALEGGYAQMVVIPDVPKGTSESAVVRHIKAHSSRCISEVLCAAPITGERGERREPISMPALFAEGASVFVSEGDDSTYELYDAMLKCKSAGYPLIVRCKESEMYKKGALSSGRASSMLKAEPIPRCAETLALAKILVLAKETGCPVHVALLSKRESFEMVRRAKAEGLNISCSVSPYHFFMIDNDVIFYGQNAKTDPPLSSEDDRLAVIEAISDGTVDAIVSNHTPCAPAEKSLPVSDAAFGAVSLDIAFSLAVSALLSTGYVDIFRLCSLFSDFPSSFVGRSNEIKEGEIANLLMLSLEGKTTVREDLLKSKAKNTPCIGMTLGGKIMLRVIGGKLVE